MKQKLRPMSEELNDGNIILGYYVWDTEFRRPIPIYWNNISKCYKHRDIRSNIKPNELRGFILLPEVEE